MKWNELYEENKCRKSREIESVKKDIILKARLKNFTNEYSKFIYIAILIISVLLIVSFYSNIKALITTSLMLIIIVLCIIYFNSFTIICKNNKVIVKLNNQKIEINYLNLKNIYIEKKQTRIFIKKRDSFSLMILYKAPNSNISNIELPILFLNKNDVQKFLDTFEIKQDKSNNISKAQKYQLKRLLIKEVLFILIWIVIIITIILKWNK